VSRKGDLIVTWRGAGVCLALAAVAAGCKVDQQKEIATYRKVVDLQWPATRPVRPAGAPLTVQEALYLANQQNERLSIEGENYLQATINRKRALAAFLPVVNLSGTYALAENSGVPGTANHSFDAYASGNINLFNGFRDVARLRAADLTIEQRRLVLLDVQESILSDTVRTFYVVLRNEQQVKVLENTLALQEERVRDIRARQAAGTARPLDVAQTEAQTSRTRVDLLNARQSAGNARAALAFLTGAPVEDVPLLDAWQDVQFGSLEEVTQGALQDRKDLQAAHRAKEAARQNVEVAVGQYYPSASLNLRGFLYRETVPTDRDWDSVLQMNLPIFSAGQIEADVRQAWSVFRQNALFESLLSRQIRQDVDIAYGSVQSSLARVAELQTQVAVAGQAVSQAEGSYNAGLATNLERLTSQDQLLSARLQLTSEIYNQRVYMSDLLRAVGGLRQRAEAAIAATTRPAAAQL
jgi:outer membrane protein